MSGSKTFKFGDVGSIITAAKPKKKGAAERTMVGIHKLAALDVVIGSLEGVRAEIEESIKTDAATHFVTTGCASKMRPLNFHATDLEASASVELRKRSSASRLSVEEIDLCDQLEIKYTVIEEVTATYVLNPAHLTDTKIMGELEKLIAAGVKSGKLPADIMLAQEGKSKTVIAEDALDTLWSKQQEVVEQALAICGTLAVGKSKFPGELEDALHVIVQALGEPAFMALAKKPRDAKSKKKAA